MAVYISIVKVQENEESALYRFSTTAGSCGKFQISKSTGEVYLKVPLNGDTEGRLFLRAAHKIKTAWKKGEFPDRSCWAS